MLRPPVCEPTDRLTSAAVPDPTNPLDHHKGLIHPGETIWFHPDHVGSGPAWLQARLTDSTLRYVHLGDFKKMIVA